MQDFDPERPESFEMMEKFKPFACFFSDGAASRRRGRRKQTLNWGYSVGFTESPRPAPRPQKQNEQPRTRPPPLRGLVV
jgi:hypothetical protein